MACRVAFLLLWAAVARGQQTPATSAWDALAAVESLQASYEQTQHRAMFTRPLTSSGSVVFARPDRLRWVVDTPSASVFVLDGGQVYMSHPDLGVRESFSIGERPELLSVMRAVTAGLRGDLAEARGSYEITEAEGRAVLRPRSAELARWVASITLDLSEDRTHLASVTLTEPDGDRVEIRFSDVRVNQELDPALFSQP